MKTFTCRPALPFSVRISSPKVSPLSSARFLTCWFYATAGIFLAAPHSTHAAPRNTTRAEGRSTATSRSSQASNSPSNRRFNASRTTRGVSSSVRNLQSPPVYNPDGAVSLEELDELNPTEEAIRAAGGVCGTLWPMSPANPAEWAARGLSRENVEKLQAGTRLFAKAINQWNKGNYRASEALFRLHLQQYPENPWAGETLLHLAEIAESAGRFGEANASYEYIMRQTEGATDGPRYELRQKTKMRWANIDLKVGQVETARAKLADILATEKHWRRRTWAEYWTLHQARMRGELRQARACGAESLSVILAHVGKPAAAKRMETTLPPRDDGFSMAEVSHLARREGVEMRGFRATPAQLAQMPLPLIIHMDWEMRVPRVPALETAKSRLKGREQFGEPDSFIAKSLPLPPVFAKWKKTGGQIPAKENTNIYRPTRSGHFLVVQKVDAKNGIVDILNEHAGLHWKYTFAQLAHEWSGTGLVMVKTPAAPQIASAPRLAWLSESEMSRIKGGTWAFLTTTGGGNDPANQPMKCQCKVGAPSWSMNRATMNLFVTDTPFLTRSAYGPDIAVTISYNSWQSSNFVSPLGLTNSKWSLNYSSYATLQSNGSVKITMPDGREEVWIANGGSFIPPSGRFDTLTTITGGYLLTAQDGSQLEYSFAASGSFFLKYIRDRYGKALTLNYVGGRLSYISNAAGINGASFVYDTNGRLIEVHKNGTTPLLKCTFDYDTSGRLKTVTDMGGLMFSYTYDSTGYTDPSSNPSGAPQHSNFLTSITNEQKGTTWQLYWEHPDNSLQHSTVLYPPPGTSMAESMRLTMTDPLSQKSEYFFHADHSSSYNGNTDGFMWYVSEKDYIPYTNATSNNGSTSVPKTLWRSMTAGQTATPFLDYTIFPNGVREDYTRDTTTGLLNYLYQRRTAGGTTYVTHFTYNAQGNITEIDYPKHNKMRWTYDATGVDVLTTKFADSLNNETVLATYSNYVFHKPRTITDATGRTTNIVYYTATTDGQTGKPQSVTVGYNTADAVTTTYEYYQPSDPNATTGRAYLLKYVKRNDLSGNPAVLAAYTWTPIYLQLATMVDRNGFDRDYTYDGLNRVTKVTYPDSTYEQYDYGSCCGLLSNVTDRAGRIMHYEYDNLDRLFQTYENYALFTDTDPNTHARVTENVYYPDSRLKQVKEPGFDAPGSALMTWTYNDAANSARKTYPDNNYEEWTYDGQGNLASYRNARAQSTTYGYDDNSNLTNVNYAGTAPDVTFGYDDRDRMASMIDGIGTTTWSYDTNSRLLSEDGPWANDVVSYTYDGAGRSKTLTTQVDATTNDVATYAYETNTGRLDTVNFASHGGNFGYNYDYNGYSTGNPVDYYLPSLPSQLQRSVGSTQLTKTAYTFEGLGNGAALGNMRRLLSVDNREVGGSDSYYSYSYDNRDIATSELKANYNINSLGWNVGYGYDAFDRLTSSSQNQSTIDPTESTTYDAPGNRLTMNAYSQAFNVATSYTSNNQDQYSTSVSSFSYPSTTHTDTYNWFYDADGNHTLKRLNNVNSRVYTYDDANQLKSTQGYVAGTGVNHDLSQFLYDGLGRLRQVTAYTWNTTTASWDLNYQDNYIKFPVRFVYSGGLIVQERNTNNAATASNVWGPSMGGGIGGLLGRNTQASGVWTQFNYLYNGRGDVVTIATAGGSQDRKAIYSYDAWGQNYYNASTSLYNQQKQPYRFSTKWTDDNSGLTYFGARWYEAGSGRFINRDPIGEDGGLNLYAYVENNPTNIVDPWGLWGAAIGGDQSYLNIGWGDPTFRFNPADSVDGYATTYDTLDIAGDPWADSGFYSRNDSSLTGSKVLAGIGGSCLVGASAIAAAPAAAAAAGGAATIGRAGASLAGRGAAAAGRGAATAGKAAWRGFQWAATKSPKLALGVSSGAYGNLAMSAAGGNVHNLNDASEALYAGGISGAATAGAGPLGKGMEPAWTCLRSVAGGAVGGGIAKKMYRP